MRASPSLLDCAPSPPRRTPRRRLRLARVAGWLGQAAVIALGPKCVGCLLGYSALAGALGLAPLEFCTSGGGGWFAPLFQFGVRAGLAPESPERLAHLAGVVAAAAFSFAAWRLLRPGRGAGAGASSRNDSEALFSAEKLPK